MTTAELISNHLSPLRLSDTASIAAERMSENSVREYPVVDGDKLIGVVRAESIEALPPETPLSSVRESFEVVSAHPDDFFLVPLKLMHQQKLSLLPVTGEEGKYLGIVTVEEMVDAAAHYNAANEPGGIILLQMPAIQFSISEIGRIVESNNAKIIHLNTWNDPASGQLMVAIKVNKLEIQDILATFERYEYHVMKYFGENSSEEGLKLNFENLMHYINL